MLECVAAEATLLYGRGMRAGIDRREQKKRAAEFEAEMLRKSRAAFGLAVDSAQTRAADLSRALAADRYEGADMRVRALSHSQQQICREICSLWTSGCVHLPIPSSETAKRSAAAWMSGCGCVLVASFCWCAS